MWTSTIDKQVCEEISVVLSGKIANKKKDKAAAPPPPHPVLLIICMSRVTYQAFIIVSDLMGAYNCQKFDPST